MKCDKQTIGRVLIMFKMLGFFPSNNMPTKLVSLQKVYMYVSRLGNTNVTYIQQREFRKCLQSAPIKEGKFDFIDTITFLSSVIKCNQVSLDWPVRTMITICHPLKKRFVRSSNKGKMYGTMNAIVM